MGKVALFTKEQKDVFNFVANDNFLSSRFYFTGGNAERKDQEFRNIKEIKKEVSKSDRN